MSNAQIADRLNQRTNFLQSVGFVNKIVFYFIRIRRLFAMVHDLSIFFPYVDILSLRHGTGDKVVAVAWIPEFCRLDFFLVFSSFEAFN
jgi:hypothetical protein